ncbi:alpha/beta hydrolase [Bosea sp. (in: a-proteobacteria)]|uniref:alpha/beta fold hydrolase n=1 Tax=Bosea sp. (in: a-proteobacteria) TaxID=1871050 RepID=UPI001ACA74C2|nr:alpha/beta hydrolase [Bosea sp. (in: a-proteobacteria)]MBN9437679.1 alpha/beta hydrolase [Bosea sp. (in: a-proteobacteria)]
MLRCALIAILLLALGLAVFSEVTRAEVEVRHPPRGAFVAVEGGRLHYRECRPAGEPRGTVVLLHGAYDNHADLLAALGPTLSSYRVIAPDRPGHGWSERLGGRDMADPGRQAQALMQGLDRIAPERFVLVGHSLGGAISSRIALERPERLQGLVLLGAMSHPWPGGIAWSQRIAATPWIGPLFSHVVGVPLARYRLGGGTDAVSGLVPQRPCHEAAGEARLLLRPDIQQSNAEDMAVAFDFLADQAPRYRELEVPVLAVAGDADTIVSPTIHSAAIAREAPQGRLLLLPGVGHMPQHVAPGLIAAAIDAMLAAARDRR